ncbi:N-acetylneuraminate synthase [Butyrivibrio sp. INlla21]|uniref:N-acetylneuraminate synthase n=1 Tax=Butyrivibrio sp. INlla21 TaxID=1520811 RepID=UPI0008E10321|nr:N-acetylneuraminate synthase [Butyrivibrio sp. INlla21]SFV02704.1 N-acetylneuraminate synthase [Butyrivibrio sp. INlla21]
MNVFIIAEAGVNHNGSFETACKMIDEAKRAGVDCIKFQTFKSDNLVSKSAKKAEYQKKTTGDGSQIEMLKNLELSFDDFIRLKEYCDKVGICFLSTPFDFDSIEFLKTIDMPFWKIPSGEITNYPYLVALAKTGWPVVMSTGMCDIKEIEDAIETLRANGTEDIKLLHCNTEYPTPFEDVNLSAMQTIRDYFKLEVGYSDHTKGIEVPIAAVALGATVIEKHFTLDRNMEGPDHKASLEPGELAQMVSSIRNIEKSIGTGIKVPSDSEKKNRIVARKSIVAKTAIGAGELFTEDNITVKRPGTGINPMRWNEVIGKKAKRDFEEDELIEI